MTATFRRLRIFVASPGDVADERIRLDQVVQAMNRTGGTAERLGLFLDLLRWETHVTPDAGRPQGVVFDQLPPADWDIFVGVLWLRFGSETGANDPVTGQPYRSGAEEEFNAAFRLRQSSATPWPKVAFYRCTRSPADMLRFDVAQYARIQQFFDGFRSDGPHPGLVQPYDKPEDFERMVREHLEKWVWEYVELKRSQTASATEPGAATEAQPVTQLPVGLASLRDKLARHFSKDELQNLCFDLGVEYEDLPAATKIGQARDLIAYMVRTDRLDELMASCRRLRPKTQWDDLDHVPAGASEAPGTSAPALSPLRERYLREVSDACCNLKLTSIDMRTATGNREAAELALDAVFTDLDVFEAPPRDEMALSKERREGGTPGERDRNRLPALAAFTRYPRLVLLGDPGSGKSTLVSFVALCLAGEGLRSREVNRKRLGKAWKLPPLLPVRVILRDYAARGLPGDKGLWQFIQGEFKSIRNSAGESLAACIPAIEAALAAKNGALLLLDGVDEVPEAQRCRVRLKEKIEQFGRDFPNCRIAVTSRPYAYQDPDAWLNGFEVRTLADFSPEQIQAFIKRWYDHIGQRDHSLGPLNAERYAAQLQAAVEHNPRLADLAPRPLLLTLMASLHRWREGGSLPERRQELYEASVGLLLDLWQHPKQIFDSQGRPAGIEYDVWKELGIGAEALRKALELVAYEAHWKQPSTEGTHDIRARDLVGVLYERSDKAKTGAEADTGERRIVAYLTNRAGLLIEREQSAVYAFPHRTFQEYLAACHLAATDFPYLLADRLREDDGRWREASLLAAARAVTGSPAPIWNLVAGFCPHDAPVAQAGSLRHSADPDWYAALRAAEALLETELHLNVPDRQAYLVDRLRGWLLALIEGGRLPPAERAAAGHALGRLGDPRFTGDLRLPDFIPIRAGVFWMGSDDAEVARVVKETGQDWAKDEAPRHQVELIAFALARFSTTNAMFDRFIAAGGYAARDWWEEAIAAQRWQDGKVKDPWGERDRPALWDDSRFNGDTQPVVGITWYEAVAYCRWLTAALNDGYVYRLPTEAEWERAARGMGANRYPWGDDWAEDRCNSAELRLERTTPVGVFPAGASPEGVLDLAGNVWEWCRDWYAEDAYQSRAGRITRNPTGPRSGNAKVLRGGSWGNDRNIVRCASRYGDFPDLRVITVGFRVARSSP